MSDTPRASEEERQWVHATNPHDFRPGKLFGWRDEASPTGWLSGFVVESDHLHLRVLVRDIAPGYIGAWRP
jgi:hypothetical protein